MTGISFSYFKINSKRFALIVLCLTTLGSLLSCTKKSDEKDDTIYAALPANVKGLDPIQAGDLYSNSVIAQMYEGLYGYHYFKRPIELIPVLAEAMPEVSKDGLVHTIKIRKGIKFQDDEAFPSGKGREVTADDFIYSWRRLADPKNRSEGFWIIDGKIKGLNEWAKALGEGKGDYSTPIEGLQAVDPYTLKITLLAPYYQLHYAMAMNYMAVVPKEAVTKYGEEFINHPVGTGPFKLTSWIRNSKIILEKNGNYRSELYPSEGEPGDKEKGLLADAGKTLPLPSKVVLTELVEDQPRWLNFQKGNFDYVSIPKDNFGQAVKGGEITPELAAKGMKLEKFTDIDVVYISFNMMDPVLGKNKKLRQAMSSAYDSVTFIDKFYNGRAVVANGPIPPGLEGFDSSFKNPYSYDLAKAKTLLKEAGFEGGKGLPEFSYDCLSDSTSRQGAEFFQQKMAEIGIKIRIRTNTWPQFTQKVRKLESQIFGMAWGADYPDAQNFLQLFYSKNVSPGPNGSNYVNKDFDKLYEQAMNVAPGIARGELYKKMQAIVVEDVPWIFNAHRLIYIVRHDWLKNLKYHPIAPHLYKYYRVDPKVRADQKSKL